MYDTATGQIVPADTSMTIYGGENLNQGGLPGGAPFYGGAQVPEPQRPSVAMAPPELQPALQAYTGTEGAIPAELQAAVAAYRGREGAMPAELQAAVDAYRAPNAATPTFGMEPGILAGAPIDTTGIGPETYQVPPSDQPEMIAPGFTQDIPPELLDAEMQNPGSMPISPAQLKKWEEMYGSSAPYLQPGTAALIGQGLGLAGRFGGAFLPPAAAAALRAAGLGYGAIQPASLAALSGSRGLGPQLSTGAGLAGGALNISSKFASTPEMSRALSMAGGIAGQIPGAYQFYKNPTVAGGAGLAGGALSLAGQFLTKDPTGRFLIDAAGQIVGLAPDIASIISAGSTLTPAAAAFGGAAAAPVASGVAGAAGSAGAGTVGAGAAGLGAAGASLIAAPIAVGMLAKAASQFFEAREEAAKQAANIDSVMKGVVSIRKTILPDLQRSVPGYLYGDQVSGANLVKDIQALNQIAYFASQRTKGSIPGLTHARASIASLIDKIWSTVAQRPSTYANLINAVTVDPLGNGSQYNSFMQQGQRDVSALRGPASSAPWLGLAHLYSSLGLPIPAPPPGQWIPPRSMSTINTSGNVGGQGGGTGGNVVEPGADIFARFRQPLPQYVQVGQQRLTVSPSGFVALYTPGPSTGGGGETRIVPWEGVGNPIYAAGQSPEEWAAQQKAGRVGMRTRETETMTAYEAYKAAREQAKALAAWSKGGYIGETPASVQERLGPILPELSQLAGYDVQPSYVFRASALAQERQIPVTDPRFLDILRELGPSQAQTSQATAPSAAPGPAGPPGTVYGGAMEEPSGATPAPTASAPPPEKPIASMARGGVVPQTGTYQLHAGEMVVPADVAPLLNDVAPDENQDTSAPGGANPGGSTPSPTEETPPGQADIYTANAYEERARPRPGQPPFGPMTPGGPGAVANVYEERSRPRPGQPPFGPMTPGGPGRSAESGLVVTDIAAAAGHPGGRYAKHEQTITVEDPRLNGGRPTLIPSVVNGVKVPMAEALEHAVKTGVHFGAFDTLGAAETAARTRSSQPWFVDPSKGVPFQAAKNPDPAKVWRLTFDPNELNQAWQVRGKQGFPLLVTPELLQRPDWPQLMQRAKQAQYGTPDAAIDLRRLLPAEPTTPNRAAGQTYTVPESTQPAWVMPGAYESDVGESVPGLTRDLLGAGR